MRMNYRKREFARMLREDQTPYEEQVWELLRNRKFMGLKFRRQHVVEGFVVDFYCHEYRFGVELDGEIHKSYPSPPGRGVAEEKVMVKEKSG